MAALEPTGGYTGDYRWALEGGLGGGGSPAAHKVLINDPHLLPLGGDVA
jgi:hypothetical protein